MAEKLPDVVLSEDEDTTDQQTSLNAEIRKCISDLKEKVKKDKEECRQFLDAASHVKKEEDESLYRNLFGMMVKDCVDAILKKEVLYTTMEMTGFRRNISERIYQDEALLDEPFNMVALPEGFQKAWRIWRAGDTDTGRSTRGEASYRAFVSTVACKKGD